MKKITRLGLMLLSFMATSVVAQDANPTSPLAPPSDAIIAGSSLTIKVQNIRAKSGQVMISLCREDEFMQDKRCGFGKIVPIKDIKLPIIINNIPNGIYAVQLFHDVNGNGKLDYNVMGIPKEPYGFSQNARGKFGPPKFQDAAIAIEKSTSINISVN